MVLRESLSGASRDDIQFPEDSETWPWSLQLQHLESIQLLILGSDIQVSCHVFGNYYLCYCGCYILIKRALGNPQYPKLLPLK